MSLSLHPGLIAEYRKLQALGLTLCVFAITSLADLFLTSSTTDALILKWRPVTMSALVLVAFLAPLLAYFLIWPRLSALRKASAVVKGGNAKNMTLKTWKKDFYGKKKIYFFELEAEDGYGCRNATFVTVRDKSYEDALVGQCERSFLSKALIRGELKAFIDSESGLPVALQTLDALSWVGLSVHLMRSEDRDKLLRTVEKLNQLSGELK